MMPDDQFNEKTSAMAERIAAWFPDRRSRIGLWGANSLDYLAALFAVLRSGHVAVPLSTRATTRELLDIAQRASLNGMLVSRDYPQSYRSMLVSIPTYSLTTRVEEESEARERVRIKELSEKEVAVLLHSSGSTGQAKIIPLTLRSLLDHAKAMCAHLKVTWHDSWVVCLPFDHIGGLAIPLRCLVSGCSLMISQTADPDELNRLVDEGEATLVSVVPTVLERMINIRSGQPFPKTLRAIIVGGGPVPERLLERCPQAYATYGLTEAGSTVTCARPGCNAAERATAGPSLPGTTVRIVDEKGKELPRGTSGEIIVRGPGMALTYIGDAATAAKTFRSGWVFTGDNGRLDEQGFLHVEGRRQDLVITGGENVSPVEIQNILLKHPRITTAIVIPIESKEWGQSPAALIVLSPGRPLQKVHIYQYLEDKLARYKFPKTVVFAETVPTLSNGKPDLKAIRKLLEGK